MLEPYPDGVMGIVEPVTVPPVVAGTAAASMVEFESVTSGVDPERGPTLARISSILLGLAGSGWFTLTGALTASGAAVAVLSNVKAAPMVMS